MSGWIKLHRKIMDDSDWLSEPFTRAQAWIDLIMMAAHKDAVVRIFGVQTSVLRGQIACSRVSLSERWGWSRGKADRFLDGLVEGQKIEITMSGRVSVITICNYSKYQDQEERRPDKMSLFEKLDGTADGTADGTTDGHKIEQLTVQQTVQLTDSKKERLSYYNEKLFGDLDQSGDTADGTADGATDGATDGHKIEQLTVQPTVHIYKESKKLKNNIIYPRKRGMRVEVWLEDLAKEDPEISREACPDVVWAEALRIKYPEEKILPAWSRFWDYWTAKTGKDATKMDWMATWRNWLTSPYNR